MVIPMIIGALDPLLETIEPLHYAGSYVRLSQIIWKEFKAVRVSLCLTPLTEKSGVLITPVLT